MRIIGCLAWYDESPSWLSTCVAGFGRVCDTIVAVDGAYGLYPGARARSRPDQAEAILAGAEAAGAGCVVHRPKDVWWGNEIEKRTHVMRLATQLSEEDDWLLVFDADELVMQADPVAVRRDLEETDCLVASFTLLDGQDLGEGERAELARQVPVSTDWTFRARDIFRWAPDLHYVGNHYTVIGTYDGIEHRVKGPESQLGAPDVQECCHLGAALVAHHRRNDRPLVRREAANGYGKLRDLRHAEIPLPEVYADTTT